MQAPVSKSLLIAWDAADWPLIEPLLDQGQLPNLESLMSTGLLGGFTIPAPLDPAVLSNSLSTGLPPEVHGILADPSDATDRRVPDLAERFAAAGHLAISVGWPASHGTGEIPNLIRVSDVFDMAPPASATDPWPLPAGSVLPESLAADIKEMRLHPGEFCPSDLAPLIDGIDRMDLTVEPRVSIIAQRLAASLSRHSAATYLMANHPWKFAAVYFPGIQGISSECLEFHPPQLAHVPDLDFARYQRVVMETYKLHDQMLGKLVEMAGQDATILLCAPRGVESGDARPSPLPGEHVQTAAFFRAAGFCVLKAPGLREDDLLHAVRLVDFAPTLLWLAGLPLPPGLPGKPLEQAVKSTGTPAPPTVDHALDQPPAPLRDLPDDANTERRLHLAIAHINAGRPAAALLLLEKLCRELPDRLGPVLHRITCLRALGRPAEAMAVLERQAARSEGGLRPRPGLRARFFPHYDFMRGLLHLDESNPEAALRCFRAALAIRPQHAGLHIQLARALFGLHQWDEAETALRSALAIDPTDGEAQYLLARLLYKFRRFLEARQPAIEAAAKTPHLPLVHLLLGFTLARLNQDPDAIICLHNALRRAPRLRPAHRLLAHLYARIPGQEALADFHARASHLPRIQHPGRHELRRENDTL